MSEDLWNQARLAVSGTESVEQTVLHIGTSPQAEGLNQEIMDANQVNLTKAVIGSASAQATVTMPVPGNPISQQGIVANNNIGGMCVQEQQITQFFEAHKNERTLRNIAKEKKKFLQEDSFELHKQEANCRLAVTPVVPLPEQRTVNVPFPINVFSGKAGKWISSFSNAYGVHHCVGGGLLLGVLSICASGKFKVQRHDDHTELMSLYQLISLASGKGKSPMLDKALQPISELQKRLQDEYFAGEGKRKAKRRILNKRIKQLENKAAKTGDFESVLEEIAELEEMMPRQMAVPQLMTFKFTAEGLEKEAARQGGKFAIVGAELGSFKKLPASKDDFILQAWGGEVFNSTKVKEPIRIEDPSLTILIATQEATSVNLLGAEALQEDGLVARFMPLVPPDIHSVVPGGVSSIAMNSEDSQWLKNTVNEIYSISSEIDGHHHFHVQDGALRGWDSFRSYAQQQAGNESNPVVLQYWYRKLAGTALRFAGFLHLLRCVENDLPLRTEIDQHCIHGGIELAQFYEAHARVVLNIESNDVLRIANRFLKRLRDSHSSEITMREIYHPEHVTADDAKKAFRFLAERGYVILLRKGKSDICIVNHRLWGVPMMY
ncbi:DUF3987 domain-containing protein [Maridesulfovibrio sp.]|uniref:DUF3987 domain-containing protein n=1 Tax=unclassified Maridesulfovibrio TaxID=2794999 RepID=UPI003B00D1BF